MQQAEINGMRMDYSMAGSGAPVLLIGTGPLADSFLPLLSEQSLAERFHLITYRQRGLEDSPGRFPVSFAEHAKDAAALLHHLGIERAHVAGHSTGAAITLQLARDYPSAVQTLTLLEPPLLASASATEFFDKVGPAVAVYQSGHPEDGMASFLSIVCSLEWARCEKVIEARMPGAVGAAMRNAENFFSSYLPAISTWEFGTDDARAIEQPVLSITGSDSDRFFIDGNEVLRSWFPRQEERRITAAAHLLHIQQPGQVVAALSDFLARHPISLARSSVR